LRAPAPLEALEAAVAKITSASGKVPDAQVAMLVQERAVMREELRPAPGASADRAARRA
jgi:hypothetical protein